MKQIREVRVKDIITYFILPLIIVPTVWIFYYLLSKHLTENRFKVIIIILLAFFSYYLIKRLAIGTVLIYKAFAPNSVRNKCRFEPTCSTYMIMAINKYGLFIGLIKGIKRICRCKPPFGGVDYP